ncbi:hypothetical protein D3C78_1761800 [compost metagenome]
MVAIGRDRQDRHAHGLQALPPVPLAIAEAAEQAVPAQRLQRQADRLVLRATAKPGA